MRANLIVASLLLLASCQRNVRPIDEDEQQSAAKTETTVSPASAPPAMHPSMGAQPGMAAHPSSGQPNMAEAEAAHAAAMPGAAMPGAAMPAGHPPIGQANMAPAAGATGAEHAGGLAWSAGTPFQRRAPKSSMRAAEYGIAGDSQAELAVFYFGAGQGGSVDANITRWLGQITQPDGSDTAQKAKRGQLNVHGVSVATVEAEGKYSGGMAMPGMPSAGPIDDAVMLGAIANGVQGPVFFKLVGPKKAVEQARPAYNALLASLHQE